MVEKRGGVQCRPISQRQVCATNCSVAQTTNDGHEQKRHSFLEEHNKKQVLEYHVSCLYEDGIAEPVVELQLLLQLVLPCGLRSADVRPSRDSTMPGF